MDSIRQNLLDVSGVICKAPYPFRGKAIVFILAETVDEVTIVLLLCDGSFLQIIADTGY